MLCRSSAELMSLRLDGLLDLSTATALEQHLQTCAQCNADWLALRDADTLLRVNARVPLAPASDFVARVMLRVAATPVVRPPLWDRVRVTGGSHTVRLPEGRRATLPLARPTGRLATAVTTQQPRNLREWLQQSWVQLYVGGLSAAAALGVLLVAALGTVLALGGAPATMLVNSTPGAPLVAPWLDAVRTALVALWHLVLAWLGGIDPAAAGLLGLCLLVCATLWVYVVRGYLRRSAAGRIEA